MKTETEMETETERERETETDRRTAGQADKASMQIYEYAYRHTDASSHRPADPQTKTKALSIKHLVLGCLEGVFAQGQVYVLVLSDMKQTLNSNAMENKVFGNNPKRFQKHSVCI